MDLSEALPAQRPWDAPSRFSSGAAGVGSLTSEALRAGGNSVTFSASDIIRDPELVSSMNALEFQQQLGVSSMSVAGGSMKMLAWRGRSRSSLSSGLNSERSGPAIESENQLIDNEMAAAFSKGRRWSVSHKSRQFLHEALSTIRGEDIRTTSVSADGERKKQLLRASSLDSLGSRLEVTPGHISDDSAPKTAELAKKLFGMGGQDQTLKQQHKEIPKVIQQIFGLEMQYSRRKLPYTAGLWGASARYLPMWMNRAGFAVRERMHTVVKASSFAYFFIAMTVYALFSPDIVAWVGRRDQDDVFLVINTTVFSIFVAEIAIMGLGLGTQGYFFTVPFLLDIIALLSFMSDALVLQGGWFRDADSLRKSGTSRMTRLLRVARVARITKLVPRLMACFGKQKGNLARKTLRRRLCRMFRFLDTDRDGLLGAFDLKLVYLLILQECPQMLGKKNKIDLLSADFGTLVDVRTKMHFTAFSELFLGTALGKQLHKYHLQDIQKEEGVWSLTSRLSDKTALKVCIGILLVIVVYGLLDTATLNESQLQSLGILEYVHRKERTNLVGTAWNSAYICDQVDAYRADHKLMYLLLDGLVYVDSIGGRCLVPGVPPSSADEPFRLMAQLTKDAGLRYYDVIQSCWPIGSECDPNKVNSVSLVDDSRDTRLNAFWSALLTSMLVFILMVFIGFFNMGITKFSKTLLEPLRALVDDMCAMTCLELVDVDVDEEASRPTMSKSKIMSASFRSKSTTKTIKVKDADEMHHLQRAFLTMRTSIRSWSMYVPPAVIQRLITSGYEATIFATRVHASILFVDVDDFEEACRGLLPEDVLHLLTEVLGTIAHCIQDNKGTLLEFIGDEVLAVFNTPNALKNHPFYAAKTTVDIHEAIAKLDLKKKDGTSFSVRCKCGVHTAQILAGNVGSRRRIKYGLLGDGVNLTARLKGLNSRYRTKTIASEDLLHDDAATEQFVTRPIDIVAVKGKTEPVTVHEILSMKKGSVFVEIAELHERAFAHYHQRAFDKAKEVFERVHESFATLHQQDELSRQFIKRCVNFMAKPPPDDWDGVERLKQKEFKAPEDECEDVGPEVEAWHQVARPVNPTLRFPSRPGSSVEGVSKPVSARSVMASMMQTSKQLGAEEYKCNPPCGSIGWCGFEQDAYAEDPDEDDGIDEAWDMEARTQITANSRSSGAGLALEYNLVAHDCVMPADEEGSGASWSAAPGELSPRSRHSLVSI